MELKIYNTNYWIIVSTIMCFNRTIEERNLDNGVSNRCTFDAIYGNIMDWDLHDYLPSNNLD